MIETMLLGLFILLVNPFTTIIALAICLVNIIGFHYYDGNLRYTSTYVWVVVSYVYVAVFILVASYLLGTFFGELK